MRVNSPECADCHNRDKSVFCDVASPHLASLETSKTANTYKPRQVIFYEGNQPYGVYCVQSGKVKIYKMDTNGHQQIVRLAGPGDLLGYRCILSGDPYTATAETLEDATICFIDKQTFSHILETHPKTALRMMSVLAQDLRHAEENMTNFVHKNVRERLAELLLLFNTRYGIPTPKGRRLDIALTRSEMAEMIGTTQESVIRLMTEFKGCGFIDVDGRKITLRDMKGLAETAQVVD